MRVWGIKLKGRTWGLIIARTNLTKGISRLLTGCLSSRAAKCLIIDSLHSRGIYSLTGELLRGPWEPTYNIRVTDYFHQNPDRRLFILVPTYMFFNCDISIQLSKLSQFFSLHVRRCKHHAVIMYEDWIVRCKHLLCDILEVDVHVKHWAINHFLQIWSHLRRRFLQPAAAFGVCAAGCKPRVVCVPTAGPQKLAKAEVWTHSCMLTRSLTHCSASSFLPHPCLSLCCWPT